MRIRQGDTDAVYDRRTRMKYVAVALQQFDRKRQVVLFVFSIHQIDLVELSITCSQLPDLRQSRNRFSIDFKFRPIRCVDH